MEEKNSNILYHKDGNLQPIKLELYESSGPVSPPYQYIIHIKLTSIDQKVHLNYKDINNSSKSNEQIDRVLSVEEYKKVLTELINNNVFDLNFDFIGDEKRKRVGVSFNFFEFFLWDKSVKFEYLLQDKKNVNFAPYEKIINIIKNLK